MLWLKKPGTAANINFKFELVSRIMIKIIDDKNTMIVNFLNDSNVCLSGKLLTYEICGEACILVDTEKIWVPFSHLTEKSQNKVLTPGTKIKNDTNNGIIKEPKIVIIITILVLILYFYFYMRYNL